MKRTAKFGLVIITFAFWILVVSVADTVLSDANFEFAYFISLVSIMFGIPIFIIGE